MKNDRSTGLALALFLSLAACRTSATDGKAEPAGAHSLTGVGATKPARRVVGTDPGGVGAGTKVVPRAGNELAAFAAGCFWGVEDNFRQVPGVVATAVGYTGGRTTNPTYETVCSHTTGHAEAVLVEYDPAKVTYEDLLRIFFFNHDPTTKDRQGPDIGDQYRSAVFTLSEPQAAAASAAAARESARRGKVVTTEIAPLGAFWKAEEYHQQYDEKTGTHSCPIPKGLARD
ncbi:MAG: peptide-methionine (S)-S-oxide reductase MsrA [Labilithrix sp.]|nr:peptide-methionine (S)-S-oxide reductase MsrA [Labilithrix sp.]